MNKYLVETISMFRIRYVVEAKSEEHATDHVTMDFDDTTEFSQKHLDSVISSVRVINDEEFLRTFDADNDYLKSWTDEQKFKFVSVIDYQKEGKQD